VTRPIRSHFFNAVWFYGAGIGLAIGMIVGQPALSLLAAFVYITAGLSWLWARYALDGLYYQRKLSATRAFRGDLLTVSFTMENRSWLPLAWVEIDEHVSDRARTRNLTRLPSDRIGTTMLRHTTPMRWKYRIFWSTEIECLERGSHQIGPVTIRSGDPFGFFTRQITIDNVESFIVYPDVVPITDLNVPPDFPFGATRVNRHLLTDPARVIGVRAYTPDDSTRHIHWKATARLQEPQVKVFEPTVDLQCGIFLNLDTFERYWEGIDSRRAESGIIAAASIASHLLDQRSIVGLAANAVVAGSDQNLRIPPGRDHRQRELILEGLARLQPMAVSSFPRLLSSAARYYPAGSTIIIIACIMTDPLVIAIQAVLERGQRVMLVRIGDIPVPNLVNLHVTSLPEDLSTRNRTNRHRYARTIHSGMVN
jgi:uncharacterized protein (DUF58 family)